MGNRGFGTVELVVAIALASVATLGVFQVSQSSLKLSGIALERARAGFLLQEGTEAMRYLRDKGWQENIAVLVPDQDYYLSFQEGAGYALVQDAESLIDGLFQRTMRVSEVMRDDDDDIAETGTLDPETRKVQVTVSWMRQGGLQDESIEFYLTNLFQDE